MRTVTMRGLPIAATILRRMDPRLWAASSLAAIALAAAAGARLAAGRGDSAAERARAAAFFAAIALATAASGACVSAGLSPSTGATASKAAAVALAYAVGAALGVAFASRYAADPRRAALATSLGAMAALAVAAASLPVVGTRWPPGSTWWRTALPTALAGFAGGMPPFLGLRLLTNAAPRGSGWTWLASGAFAALGAGMFSSGADRTASHAALAAGMACWAIAAATRPASPRPRDLR
jgi:hypothetical protein